MVRLLLVDGDELRELWDALLAHEARLAEDPASFSLEVTHLLRERVGDLLADDAWLLEEAALGAFPLSPDEFK